MELKLSSNFSGKPVSVVVPIEKVIEVFWPKGEKPPISLTVSTVLGADSANAEFSLGEETKESYPGIWLTTDNVKKPSPLFLVSPRAAERYQRHRNGSSLRR